MKKFIPLIIVIAVLIIAFVFRWQLDVGSDCVLEPYTEESQVIYAQTPGVLTVFNYRSGDIVKQGSVVGQLTSIELQDEKEQVEASIKETQAEQIVLDRRIQEARQEVISSGLRHKKASVELASIENDLRTYNAGELPPELQAMKARLNEAQREYEKLAAEQELIDNKNQYPPDIKVIVHKLESARVKYHNAEISFDKNRYLVTVGAISQLDFEDNRTKYEMAQQEVSTYRAELDNALLNRKYDTLNAKDVYLKAKSEYETSLKEFFLDYDRQYYDSKIAGAMVAQSSYTKETTEAQLQANDEKLAALKQKLQIINDKMDRLALKAPISGVVIEEDITNLVGKYFSMGEQICEIAGLEKLLVNIQVDEKDIADVEVGQSVRLKVRPFLGSLFKGEVRKISPVSRKDEKSHRSFYSVELVIANEDNKLKPGMTGFAKINAGTRPIYALIMREVGHLVRSEYWFF
jgi:multidrug resistance efflux pump